MGIAQTALDYVMKHKIATGMNLMYGITSYNDARDDGHGVIMSGVEAAANVVAGMALGGPAAALVYGLNPAVEIGVAAVHGIDEYGRSLSRLGRNIPFSNSHFVDFRTAHTMRQAGMNLAAQSRYAVQQAMLGNEAQMINQ